MVWSLISMKHTLLLDVGVDDDDEVAAAAVAVVVTLPLEWLILHTTILLSLLLYECVNSFVRSYINGLFIQFNLFFIFRIIDHIKLLLKSF